MLTSKQRKFLRGLAHALDPVGFVGAKGVSEAVIAEVERHLTDHELIKIKIASDSQADFTAYSAEIMAMVPNAEKVQAIGHMLVLYRPSLSKEKDKRIQLPA